MLFGRLDNTIKNRAKFPFWTNSRKCIYTRKYLRSEYHQKKLKLSLVLRGSSSSGTALGIHTKHQRAYLGLSNSRTSSRMDCSLRMVSPCGRQGRCPTCGSPVGPDRGQTKSHPATGRQVNRDGSNSFLK